MEDQLVENMEIDEDNYSSEDDDEVNELIREIFGDEESLEEEQEEEEEYEDGNEMWNETRPRENYEDEYSLLRERRFVVGEGALVSLIKRTTCEQCGEPIDPSTVVEGEKIPAGVKYKFLCCPALITSGLDGGRVLLGVFCACAVDTSAAGKHLGLWWTC